MALQWTPSTRSRVFPKHQSGLESLETPSKGIRISAAFGRSLHPSGERPDGSVPLPSPARGRGKPHPLPEGRTRSGTQVHFWRMPYMLFFPVISCQMEAGLPVPAQLQMTRVLFFHLFLPMAAGIFLRVSIPPLLFGLVRGDEAFFASIKRVIHRSIPFASLAFPTYDSIATSVAMLPGQNAPFRFPIYCCFTLM